MGNTRKWLTAEEAAKRDQLLLKFTDGYITIADMIREGNRIDFDIEPLLMAMQNVIDDQFSEVQRVVDLKELLLSSDPKKIRFGWRRLFKQTELAVVVPECPGHWTPETLANSAMSGRYPIFLPHEYIADIRLSQLLRIGKSHTYRSQSLFEECYHHVWNETTRAMKGNAYLNPSTGWVMVDHTRNAFKTEDIKPAGYAPMNFSQFLFFHLFMVISGKWTDLAVKDTLLCGELYYGEPIRACFDKKAVVANKDEGRRKGTGAEYYIIEQF